MDVDEERTTLDEGEPRHAKAAADWEDGTTVEESTLAQGKAYRDANNPFRPEVAGSTTNTTATEGQTLDELTVEEHARRKGCCKLTLEVQDDNTRARGLYQSFGFDDYVVRKPTPTRFLVKALDDASMPK